MRRFSAVVLVSAVALAAEIAVTPEVRALFDRISADSLKGHVSFLASDLLAGRDTPSPGLDIAAEYIAAQFRRAGIEPAGDDGYFQTARYAVVKPSLEGFELTIERGGERVAVPKDAVAIASSGGADLTRAAVVKAPLDSLSQFAPEQVKGKVLITAIPDLSPLRGEERERAGRTVSASRRELARLKPAAAIVLAWGFTMMRQGRLREASQSPPTVVHVNSPELRKLYDSMPPGAEDATATLNIAPAAEDPVDLKNVAGILRGSDPSLRDTYVLVTAHYDHTGVRAGGEGDRIMNGANDDASGTAAVIELAAAFSKVRIKPRRSVLFVAYFGEEKGLLGSRYYGGHPLAPIDKTVANINLEHLGRTDDIEGPQIGRASLTGFDYSDLGATFRKAGEATGVEVFKHEKNSDLYFNRSDNQTLADLGVPAHTISVSYIFPDYHQTGDHWDKLDYENMEKITRMIAAGVLMVANDPEQPKWNEANPRARRYAAKRQAPAGGSH